jgi:hypothetical protein
MLRSIRNDPGTNPDRSAKLWIIAEPDVETANVRVMRVLLLAEICPYVEVSIWRVQRHFVEQCTCISWECLVRSIYRDVAQKFSRCQACNFKYGSPPLHVLLVVLWACQAPKLGERPGKSSSRNRTVTIPYQYLQAWQRENFWATSL